MAERSHSISKLKRRKLSLEETLSKKAPQKNNSPLCFDGTTVLDKSTTGPVVDATVRWWNGSNPCALENLWALTLKSALSSLDTQDEWGSVVPDLPMASSAVTPTTVQLGTWRWPDLGEEVPPLPELSAIPGPSPPDSLCAHATPAEAHLPVTEEQSPHRHSPGPASSSHGEDEPQQRTAATSQGVSRLKRQGTLDDRAHATSSNATQGKSSERPTERAPCRAIAKSRPPSIKESQTSMQSWVKAPPPQPGIIASSERKGTEGRDGESSMRVTKRPPACQRENSDSCPPPHGQGVDKRSVEGKVVPAGPSGSSGEGSGGGGGETLQTCPMCLVAFPAGFAQMDIDSHLAQCLSEMTMDMTW